MDRHTSAPTTVSICWLSLRADWLLPVPLYFLMMPWTCSWGFRCVLLHPVWWIITGLILQPRWESQLRGISNSLLSSFSPLSLSICLFWHSFSLSLGFSPFVLHKWRTEMSTGISRNETIVGVIHLKKTNNIKSVNFPDLTLLYLSFKSKITYFFIIHITAVGSSLSLARNLGVLFPWRWRIQSKDVQQNQHSHIYGKIPCNFSLIIKLIGQVAWKGSPGIFRPGLYFEILLRVHDSYWLNVVKPVQCRSCKTVIGAAM